MSVIADMGRTALHVVHRSHRDAPDRSVWARLAWSPWWPRLLALESWAGRPRANPGRDRLSVRPVVDGTDRGRRNLATGWNHQRRASGHCERCVVRHWSVCMAGSRQRRSVLRNRVAIGRTGAPGGLRAWTWAYSGCLWCLRHRMGGSARPASRHLGDSHTRIRRGSGPANPRSGRGCSSGFRVRSGITEWAPHTRAMVVPRELTVGHTRSEGPIPACRRGNAGRRTITHPGISQ